MDCEWTEKVSALLDEELEDGEALRLREHMLECALCRQAQAEFLILRREIKSHAVEAVSAARQNRLHKILASENVPFWKRSVALPLPALSVLLLALVFLGVWTISVRRQVTRPLAGREEKPLARQSAPQSSSSEIDLARFDHGGRATIYKTRRENRAGANQ